MYEFCFNLTKITLTKVKIQYMSSPVFQRVTDLFVLHLMAGRNVHSGRLTREGHMVAQMVESACNAGDPGLIPGSGRSPEGGNSSLLQCSYLGNPMDKEAWWVGYRTYLFP